MPLRAKRFKPPHHYDQTFTAHGVIKDLLRGDAFRYRSDEPGGSAADGARDVGTLFLNNLSFWFTVVGVILVNVSLGG